MKVIFRFLCFCFCFLFGFDVCPMQLQMDVFDTGQGNFIVLHTQSRALVVDCGCTKAGPYPISYYTDKYAGTTVLGEHVRSIFRARETKVIITHDHADHNNLLEYFSLTSNPILDYDRTHSAAYFSTALGDNISVDILFLKTNLVVSPQVHPFGDGDHDKNLVVKITTSSTGEGGQKRSILLTGDANGTLLSSLLYVPENMELLKDIDCLVIPHHGSNDSGEFAWLSVKDFVSGSRLLPNLLTLVASDPDKEKNTAVDVLPWPELQHFSYKRASFGQILCTCFDHSISTRSREKASGSWKSSSATTTTPVFTTCSATQGFYRVTINLNGDIALYDGLFDKPLYYSFSPYVEQFIKNEFTSLSIEFENWLKNFKPLVNPYKDAEAMLARVAPYDSRYICEQMLSMPIFKLEWRQFLQVKGLWK